MVKKIALFAMLIGAIVWAQAMPPSSAVSFSAAGAGTSGTLTWVGPYFVLDAGIYFNTPNNVPITTNSATNVPIIRDLRSGAGSHILACLGDSTSTCYYPIGVDLVGEEIFVSQAASVTTRFRDRSNEGTFTNVAFAGPKYACAASGSNTKVTVLDCAAPTSPVACTSPTITHGNMVSFQADVGSACGVSTFAFTAPAATNGWSCVGWNITTAARDLIQTGGFTGTTITMTNHVRTTGVAGNFASGDDVVINCVGR